jgi:serine/threonine protein kinase
VRCGAVRCGVLCCVILQSDIWSLGITALELTASGEPPNGAFSAFQVMNAIAHGPPPALQPPRAPLGGRKANSKNWSEDFKDFVKTCAFRVSVPVMARAVCLTPALVYGWLCVTCEWV